MGITTEVDRTTVLLPGNPEPCNASFTMILTSPTPCSGNGIHMFVKHALESAKKPLIIFSTSFNRLLLPLGVIGSTAREI